MFGRELNEKKEKERVRRPRRDVTPIGKKGGPRAVGTRRLVTLEKVKSVKEREGEGRNDLKSSAFRLRGSGGDFNACTRQADQKKRSSKKNIGSYGEIKD